MLPGRAEQHSWLFTRASLDGAVLDGMMELPFCFASLCPCQVMMTLTLTSRRTMNPTVTWKRDGCPSCIRPWRCSCKVPQLALPLPCPRARETAARLQSGLLGFQACKHTALLLIRSLLLTCLVVIFAADTLTFGPKKNQTCCRLVLLTEAMDHTASTEELNSFLFGSKLVLVQLRPLW